MAKFLKLAIWNANGLPRHVLELKAFIINNDIDIMLISETHFTKRSYIKIPNYMIYSTNHPDGTAHGGTAIIIKSTIKHYELNPYSTDYLQATSLSVMDWHGPLTITAIYSPPRHSINSEQYTQFFSTLGNRFLAAGDYNAKHTHWGSRLITPKGRQLLAAMVNKNLDYISTGEPTYWPTDINKTPDLVDFGVSRGVPRKFVHVESCFELSSDHSPVLITISTEILMKELSPTLGNKFTNWDGFRETLDSTLYLKVPLKSIDDIDNAVEYFTKTIQEAVWKSTPDKLNSHASQDVPLLIKGKIADKRRLRKTWQRTRAPSDKTRLNQATRELKILLNNDKNNRIQNYLKELSASAATEYSLWKATKTINRPQISNPPLRTTDGNWAMSNKDKAEVFARHLVDVFQPHPPENNYDIEKEVEQFLNEPYQLDLPPQSFTVHEVQRIILTNLNPKKSPGYDLIGGRILKELSTKGLQFLTQLYNSVLRTGYFPLLWKVAQVILIPKPGKPAEEAKSYRPISLLPIMSKVLEKLLIKKLEPVLRDDRLIPKHQFGFRREHATIEQIHRVTKEINQSLEGKKYCSAAFLDIAQAFDKVWHAGLLYKIKQLLPVNYFLILKSYLQDRHFQVKYQDQYTELHPINAGVPQGSVLGPVLYLLYTADLPVNHNVTTATYADDTAILSSHQDPVLASQGLQANLDVISAWFKTWRIKVNENKSVHVTFTQRKNTCPTVFLNSHPLQQQQHAKYLGMHLDRRLTWRTHIFMKRKQLGMKLSKLYWILGRRSQLSIRSKLLVYKVILKPIWCYGIQLWGTASNSNIEILERFQSKVLRTIVDAPWYVPNKVIAHDLHMCSVKEEVSNYSQKYANRLSNHPNTLARTLMRPHLSRRRLRRHLPCDLPGRF